MFGEPEDEVEADCKTGCVDSIGSVGDVDTHVGSGRETISSGGDGFIVAYGLLKEGGVGD